MAESADDKIRDKAVARYGRLEALRRTRRLRGRVGGRADLQQPGPAGQGARPAVAHPVGQRRRIELARILFAASDGSGKSDTTLLLDEPTNHLDADSITWLRGFLQPRRRPGRDQPRRRAAGRCGEPGVVPGRGAW